MILHVHKDRTDDLNLAEVANEFVSVKEQRKAVFGNFVPAVWLMMSVIDLKTYVIPTLFGIISCDFHEKIYMYISINNCGRMKF